LPEGVQLCPSSNHTLSGGSKGAGEEDGEGGDEVTIFLKGSYPFRGKGPTSGPPKKGENREQNSISGRFFAEKKENSRGSGGKES